MCDAAAVARQDVVERQVDATRPQYWQVWRSRAKTSRRVSLTRGRGRLIAMLEPDHGRRMELLGDRPDDLVVVLEDLGLRPEDEPERPRKVA